MHCSVILLCIVHQQNYFDAGGIGAMRDKRWLEDDYLPIGIMHNNVYFSVFSAFTHKTLYR